LQALRFADPAQQAHDPAQVGRRADGANECPLCTEKNHHGQPHDKHNGDESVHGPRPLQPRRAAARIDGLAGMPAGGLDHGQRRSGSVKGFGIRLILEISHGSPPIQV
jgi:hypothetical protein